jgi:hypothetical protein
MNKKQFLLLSLLVCLSAPHNIFASKTRAALHNGATFFVLAAGAYLGVGLSIGNNNKKNPLSEEEKEAPFQAGFKELNSMIVKDCIHFGTIAQEKYSILTQKTTEFLEKIKSLNHEKQTPSDDTNKDANDKK